MHLPSSKTTLIQIIGRALRKHETKTIANIILPFSSKEDETNICNFLKVIAKNDKRVKQSFESKTLGGYININKVDEEEDDKNNDDDDEIEFKYNMIYDSMGILTNGTEIWMKRLEDVKQYINENGKRPCVTYKDIKIRKLGKWLSHQKTNYKKNQDIMKNNIIKKLWYDFTTKYKQYFLLNDEIWLDNLKEVEYYIIKNNEKPYLSNKDIKIKKLALWIYTQHINYKNNKGTIKNKNISKTWLDFTIKYKQYFLLNNEVWFDTLKLVEDYIIKYNKRPSQVDKDIEIKHLGSWLSNQQKNYLKNEQIMNDETIRKSWFDFTTKYKQYFLSNNELWFNSLKEVEEYIVKNNKRPSAADKDIKIKQLGSWINTQQQNYSNNEYIMQEDIIKKAWFNFTTKYKQYFLSNNKIWFNHLKQLEDYIHNNSKKPSSKDKDIKIKKMGIWIGTQRLNYSNNEQIMKDDFIKKAWLEFTIKYKEYFLSNNQIWFNTLKLVEEYIVKNNKRPSAADKDIKIKQLGSWLSNQLKNYNENIIKDETIKKVWINFTTKYKQYFLTNNEEWFNTLKLVKNYIIKNNKRPSSKDKDVEIKHLGSWLSHQQENYYKNKKSMNNKIIKKSWEEFINDNKYKQYFKTVNNEI
jgi:hypothetical protein